jgi:outer membrane protein OmpA-like peptidoglycan-associated protein
MSKKLLIGLLSSASIAIPVMAEAATNASAPAPMTKKALPKIESVPMLVEREDLRQAMPNAIVFGLGESQVNAQFLPILQWNAGYLHDFPTARIEVSGNADDYKSSAANDKLSLQRAQNIRSALLSLGVFDQQMDVYALGDRRQAFKKDSDGHQPRNQRVDIFYTRNAPQGYTVEKVPVVMTDTYSQVVTSEPVQ